MKSSNRHLGLALALCSGCALIEGVTAKTVVAGSVFATPELALTGWLDVTPEVAASTWVGEREDELSTAEPKPVLDASVHLAFDGRRVKMPGRGDGLYGVSSLDGDLIYSAGATYEFEVGVGGESYGGRTVAPAPLGPTGLVLAPAPTSRADLPPGVLLHPKSTALTVTWPLESGRYAYLTVFRADQATPDRPELVFDTRPKTAKEILDFVTGNPPTQLEIPAGTFSADGVYAVVLVAANNGEKVGDVFGVSAFLVGSGTAQILVVGDVTL
jgi:hypothetical protein